MGSVVVACGLSGCSTRASLLCGMYYLSAPGMEPVSPVLAGELLSTIPPGQSEVHF